MASFACISAIARSAAASFFAISSAFFSASAAFAVARAASLCAAASSLGLGPGLDTTLPETL